MKLSKEAIEEFKSIYESDMKIKISTEEAIAKAIEYITVIKILMNGFNVDQAQKTNKRIAQAELDIIHT